MNLKQVWQKNLSEAGQVLADCLQSEPFMNGVEAFSQLAIDCFKAQGNIFACGNGGSHCDAMHFCEELTGRYRKNREPLGALALGDPSHVTCVGNDYGFDHIFSRQLQGLGRTNDLLVAITTSGNSQNVLNALEVAVDKGMKVVALTGKDGGKIKDMAHLSIIVPSQVTDRIQEVHIKIIHTVIQSIERNLFPENYQ